MLMTIAASFGASLTKVAATASLYYLLYGGMQPVGGPLRRSTVFSAVPGQPWWWG